MDAHSIPNASGIYRILNTINGKFYLGSALNLAKRRREHLHGLRHNVHHSITLQRAFNKYGEQAFKFEVVELVLAAFLLIREQIWLDKFRPFDPAIGYNINCVAGSRFGMEVSPETKEKLRQANLGKKQSPETIRKRVEANKDFTHSAETKEIIRLIRLDTKRSPESCERSRISHLGKTQSPETIERRRLSRLGYTPSAESRVKSSVSNANAKPMKPLIAVSPDGTEYVVHRGLSAFCKAHNLASSNLTNVAKGKLRHTKGWTARYI